MASQNFPGPEYRTTFTEVPDPFPKHEVLAEQLSRISPKPPRGENWQLVTTAVVGRVIFYYWERPAQEPAPHPTGN